MQDEFSMMRRNNMNEVLDIAHYMACDLFKVKAKDKNTMRKVRGLGLPGDQDKMAPK